MTVTRLILSSASSKTKTIMFVVLLFVMLVVAGALAIQQRRNAPPESVPVVVFEETLYKQVSRHLILPAVRPSVSRVDDVAALQQANAVFYHDAQIGDWVLAFPTLVVLYRASTDRVIFSMPVIVK